MSSQAIGLFAWHVVGFVVVLPVLGYFLLSELNVLRKRDLLVSKHVASILLAVIAFSAVWQFSNPSYGADYGVFGKFADIFLKYGTNFYVLEGQSSGSISNPTAFVGQYPHNYVYGPVSVVLLALLRNILFDWTTLYRVLLVFFNIVSGLAIYSWFKGTRGLVGSIVFLFNPLLHYTLNAGLNDSFMIGFLVLGLYALRTDKILPSGLLFSLAILTKQNAVFVVIPVLAWLYFRDRRRFAISIASMVAASAAISIPFLLTSQSRTAYFEAVLQYPALLSMQGKDLVSGLPNIGFSGIWSVLRDLGVANPFLFSLSSLTEVLLMILALLVVWKRRPQLSDTSLLGYSVFLLGSKYIWNNHFVAFLPLSVLVLLTVPASKTRVLLLSTMIASGLMYVVLDGVSYLTSSYPPNYIIPDFTFFLIVSAFFLWRTKSVAKPQGFEGCAQTSSDSLHSFPWEEKVPPVSHVDHKVDSFSRSPQLL